MGRSRRSRARSPVGQSRRLGSRPATSGLARRADILATCRHVANVPRGDMRAQSAPASAGQEGHAAADRRPGPSERGRRIS